VVVVCERGLLSHGVAAHCAPPAPTRRRSKADTPRGATRARSWSLTVFRTRRAGLTRWTTRAAEGRPIAHPG
jgi:hypothetical protein